MKAYVRDQIKNNAKNMQSMEKGVQETETVHISHRAGLRPEVTDAQLAGYL